MNIERSTFAGSEELNVAILQGPASSGKSTVAAGLEEMGFTTIGLGTFYRRIDSLYIAQNPNQIKSFCAGQFTDFMIDYADEVRAVMTGEVDAPHEDLRHPDIQATVSHVGEADITQQVVNDHAIDLLSDSSGLVFMEGRALDIILRERARVGQFTGRVVANFFIDVSDEVALARNLCAAEKKGIELDPEEELEKIQARNRRDTERSTNPMVLPVDNVFIDRPINTPTAYTVGQRARIISRLRQDIIPQCVHLQTDNLKPEETRRISQDVTNGGLGTHEPVLTNQLVDGTLVRNE